MTIEPFWLQVNESSLRQGDLLPDVSCQCPGPVSRPKVGRGKGRRPSMT
jgi:hypothetical protein